MFLEQNGQDVNVYHLTGSKQANCHGKLVIIMRTPFISVLEQIFNGILETTLQVLVTPDQLIENINMFFDAFTILFCGKYRKWTAFCAIVKYCTSGCCRQMNSILRIMKIVKREQ